MTQALEEAPIRRPPSTGGRVPPHNLDAEESLIGAMLLSRDAIASALVLLAIKAPLAAIRAAVDAIDRALEALPPAS